MVPQARQGILRQVLRLVGRARADEHSDGHLLGRFAEHQDETAFAALMERHGPMVLGVCRRVLGQTADAEDAFQATFMVLLRRAGDLAGRATVGGWLYTVAYHTALRARGHAARRRLRELEAAHRERSEPMDERVGPDLRNVLDEELNRLPEKYRAPLVLCYLEGKTNEEAARLLGWTLRSVTGRLARARQALHRRLSRRGCTLAGAALAAALTEDLASAALPASLSDRTMQAALAGATGAALPSSVAALTEEMVRTMFPAKLKIVATVLVALTVTVSAAGMFLGMKGAADPPKDQDNEEPPAAQREAPEDTDDWVRTLTIQRATHVLAFAPDGKSLASGDGRIRIWDVGAGKEVRQIDEGTVTFDSFAFAPDGTKLATGGSYGDNSVRLWDLATGKQLHRLSGHEGGVNSVAFSPDGRFLVSGAYKTATVFVWDVAEGKEVRRLVGKPIAVPIAVQAMDGKPAPFASVAWSRDGTRVAGGDLFGGVHLWDTKSWTEPHSFRGVPQDTAPRLRRAVGVFTRVAFAGAGQTLVSWAGDSWIHIWSSGDGTELRAIDSPQNQVRQVAASPDGRMLASVGEGTTVYLWDTATGTKRAELTGHTRDVYSAAFAPHGRLLATGSLDGTIRLWDLRRRGKAVGHAEATPEKLAAWWANLRDKDGARAYESMEALMSVGGLAVAYLDKQLVAVPKVVPEKVARLVSDLAASEFAVRDRAMKELASLGETAEPALRQELATKPSLEVTRRIEQLLAALERERRTPAAEWLQQDRALEVLELIGSAEARGVLQRLAAGAAGARLTRTAEAALQRGERRGVSPPVK